MKKDFLRSLNGVQVLITTAKVTTSMIGVALTPFSGTYVIALVGKLARCSVAIVLSYSRFCFFH